MKKALFACVAVFTLFLFTGCEKYDEPVSLIKKVTVQLSGARVVPANTSTGTGSAEISYDPTMKMITYKIVWQLGATAATTTKIPFHTSETGSDMIMITGFTTGSSGTLNGMTVALTDSQIAQLLAGKWYIQIHSSTLPGGELRGNIKF